MDLEFRVLQAEHGDAIVISVDFEGARKNILIDGGPAKTFEFRTSPRPLKLCLNEIKSKSEFVDLLILTHVDDDHIGGLLVGFNKPGYLSDLTKEVWFNSGKLVFNHFNQPLGDSNYVILKNNVGGNTSIAQGVKLENYLEEKNTTSPIWTHPLIKAGDEFERFGCKFKFLSPSLEKLEKLLVVWEKKKAVSNTSGANKDYSNSLEELILVDEFKEDNSIHNGSSLAFIFEYLDKSLLLLGDAHPSVIVANLRLLGYSVNKPLKIDYVKVSHHGSKANTNDELLSLLDCNNFIISANGRHHGLPNKKTLARILNNFPSANLYFNYPDLIGEIFSSEELKRANFKALHCKDIILV